MTNARHVDPAAAERNIGGREEIEIFASFVERRSESVTEAIGNLGGFGGVERVGVSST
jgi:hypothetical protein